MTISNRKQVIGWTLYDWANSTFSTTIIAGFFPIFFKDYWSTDISVTQSTFWLGVSVSTAGLIIALFSPILGAIADQGGYRKRLLLFFAALGIISTSLFFFIGEGQWHLAATCYVIANIGFLGSFIFYDALLIDVTTSDNYDWISGLGYSMGYLGGGLLFVINVFMVQMPELFGLASPVEGVRWSFVTVAVWWAVFSIPLFKWVEEKKGPDNGKVKQAIRDGIHEYFKTIKQIWLIKPVAFFLVAYWLYIDGVDTIISMAVDFGKSIGFENTDLITALIVVQFVGFPFALLFGWLGKRFGPKPLLFLAIVIYLGVTVIGANLSLEPWSFGGMKINQFLGLAVLIGMVQGGIQSLSRSYFARLVPANKNAEFFGFYNMIGKFAAIIGPILIGTITVISGSNRNGILSISVLFLLGAVFLMLSRPPAAMTDEGE